MIYIMKSIYNILLLCPLFISACTTTQKSTGMGTVTGGVLGAITGAAISGKAEGALAGGVIGSMAGGAAGYAHGRYKEIKELTNEQQRRIAALEREAAQSGQVLEEHNIDDQGGAVIVRIDKKENNTPRRKCITTEYLSPDGRVIDTRKKIINI